MPITLLVVDEEVGNLYSIVNTAFTLFNGIGEKMDSAEKYQRQLLEQAKAIYFETPLSDATQKAYLETPRHKFVRRYRLWGVKEWSEVNEGNLEEHLAT